MKSESSLRRHLQRVAISALVATSFAGVALADETCNSPYMGNLIKGQEDYVYVWTLGVEGSGRLRQARDHRRQSDVQAIRQGDSQYRSAGAAKRITWASPTTAASSGPAGSTTARSSSSTSRTNPAQAEAREDDHRPAAKTGYLGPHTFYAMPGPHAGAGLSNAKDKGGVTGIAVYNNKGDFIAKYADADRQGRRRRLRLRHRGQSGEERDAHLELRRPEQLHARPRRSWWRMASAMKKFGNTMVVWDLKAHAAEAGLQRAGRAAGDPLVAASRATTGPSPRRR